MREYAGRTVYIVVWIIQLAVLVIKALWKIKLVFSVLEVQDPIRKLA